MEAKNRLVPPISVPEPAVFIRRVAQLWPEEERADFLASMACTQPRDGVSNAIMN